MTADQITVLRRVASAAQQKDADIGMSAAVVLTLLDALDALRDVTAAWQARAWRAEAEAAALRVELARCRARLTAAERVVRATRS